MKRKHKLMLSIGMIGIFTMSGSAWAEDQFRNVEVFFQRVNIAINGQQANLSKDSILYEGSVYVPLRSLSEMLGAQVGWDNETGTVHLDFIKDNKNTLFTASQKGIYQYVAIQNNQITKDLIPMFKNTEFDNMKYIVERYAALSKIVKNIDDNTMSQTSTK
ncbi:copper amine oxidase N-terminal domain-containing protein [Paenibacillus sp. yr247]|uniref:copper amine oxidase N-terminal domain-containing protein n=1 Tax=Paenibacillus sp. yr247 TaxID=1761880 RepID=UPI000B85CEFB|nr:copper amine oxidase N-terminal domain-containing protein [Paenibacillus sp. yr247]